MHAVSAKEKNGIDVIAGHLGPGKTGALLGSSGVDKSTLVNAMVGQKVASWGVAGALAGGYLLVILIAQGVFLGPSRPKAVIVTPDLPKTRSGKIMRRLLRDVAEGRDLGDTTTLADASIVTELQRRASETPQED